MNNGTSKHLKLTAMAAALPFLGGCVPGAGTGSLIGFLFGSGTGGGITLLASGGTGLSTGGAALASLHNPEPASMLLVGGGLMAMGYFKSKTSRKIK